MCNLFLLKGLADNGYGCRQMMWVSKQDDILKQWNNLRFESCFSFFSYCDTNTNINVVFYIYVCLVPHS